MVGGSGGHGSSGAIGGIPSHLDARFAESDVGKTLMALSDDFDFVLFGSAAARIYAGDSMGSLPHDIDVIGLSQNTETISDRWYVTRHSDDPTAIYNIIDTETGIQVQTFESGRSVGKQSESGYRAEFRIPALFDVAGKPEYVDVDGVKVMKPEPLLESMNSSMSPHIGSVIKGLSLPRDYIDVYWYRAEWDDVQ